MRSIYIKDEFMEMIRSGRKNLEIRAGYPSIRRIKPGEQITIKSSSREQTVYIRDIREYRDHEELLDNEDYQRIAPHINEREEVLNLLNEIYPEEKQKLGIIVFEIECIKHTGDISNDG